MEFFPIHPEFGAEVRGAGLLDVVSRDDVYRAVREAFEQYSVLVWRDQDVTDDLQATASRAFGPLEVTKVGSLGEGTVYGRITNIGPDGQPVPPDHRQALVGKANALWHTDSSFKQTPAVASMLSARIVPSDGGATEFVSTRAAWGQRSSRPCRIGSSSTVTCTRASASIPSWSRRPSVPPCRPCASGSPGAIRPTGCARSILPRMPVRSMA
jgi:alpha-ketoglutarate-dependent taurine dioxygenase